MSGVIRSETRAVTTAANATPITMPTAMSTRLPLSRNPLKSFMRRGSALEDESLPGSEPMRAVPFARGGHVEDAFLVSAPVSPDAALARERLVAVVREFLPRPDEVACVV